VHFLNTLLSGDGLPGSLSRTGIAPGPLAANGQTSPMPQTPVAANITQTGDILAQLAPELSLHDIIPVNDTGNAANFIIGKFFGTDRFRDLGFFENLFGKIFAYTIYIC